MKKARIPRRKICFRDMSNVTKDLYVIQYTEGIERDPVQGKWIVSIDPLSYLRVAELLSSFRPSHQCGTGQVSLHLP